MHLRATCCHRDGRVTKFEVVLPPAAIEGTGAACLMAALTKRLPWSFAKLHDLADFVVLISNSDSARSCLKLGRHLQSLIPCLPSPCRMHQLCICMTAVLTMGGVMSPLFCACHLLRRKSVQTMMRKQLRRLISDTLRIVFSEPSQEATRQVAKVLTFVMQLIGHDGVQVKTQQKRLGACRRLRQFLAGPVRESQLITHFCPLGCHASRETAVKQFYDDIVEVFLAHPPAPPAFNKWTKLFPPVAWFASFCCLHFILPGCLANISDLLREEEIEMNIVEHVEGLNDDVSFRRQEQVRFRKTSNFLNAAVTPDKLVGIAITLEVAVKLLGHFFDGASRYNPSDAHSVLPLLKSSSPGRVAARSCLSLLQEPQHANWDALVGSNRPWSESLYIVASAPLWVMVGQIWRRFDRPFHMWPWRLAQFVNDEVSEGDRQLLATELYRADDCDMDPFTTWIRSKFLTSGAFLADDNLRFLRLLFESTPASNIHSENRFSRCRSQIVSAHGNPALPSTLAAAHMLSEAKTILDTTVRPVCSGAGLRS